MPTPPLYTSTITGIAPTRIITHIGTQYIYGTDAREYV